MLATSRRLCAAVAACGLAQALATQIYTPPVLEWGPGMAARTELLMPRSNRLPAIAVDVDQDGDIDFLQLESWNGSGLLTVLENQGNGVLAVWTYPPATSASWAATGIAAGDIDGDGDVDVVFAAFWSSANGGTDRPWVHLNNGTGRFSLDTARFPRAPSHRTGCVLTDVDRDRDLDAVFTGPLAPFGALELWLNDGFGFFSEVTSTHIPPGTDCASNAAAGDINGDGFPEIVIGTTYDGLTSKRILWNDGTGNFTVQILPPNNSAYYCYLRDVDLDGDLDIFFKGGQSMLFMNEPFGLRQVLVPNPVPATAYYPAAFGDIDADGDPDLVFAGSIFEPSVLLNDGRGNFRDAPGWIHGDWRRGVETTTFADLDGDGDEDAFATPVVFIQGYNGAVFFNQHRQVWGPLTAARGSTYTLDVRGRRNASFVVALSGARLQQPWSLGALGQWHLDPATMVTLGTVSVGSEGQGAVRIPIPNAPHLVGRSVYTQGLDLGTAAPRLEHTTNWWSVRVQ